MRMSLRCQWVRSRRGLTHGGWWTVDRRVLRPPGPQPEESEHQQLTPGVTATGSRPAQGLVRGRLLSEVDRSRRGLEHGTLGPLTRWGQGFLGSRLQMGPKDQQLPAAAAALQPPAHPVDAAGRVLLRTRTRGLRRGHRFCRTPRLRCFRQLRPAILKRPGAGAGPVGRGLRAITLRVLAALACRRA